MIHEAPHPFTGKTVTVIVNDEEHEFLIEDWVDRINNGESWKTASNPAAFNYAMRIADLGIPLDDEVLYGKIGAFGHIVHVSELKIERDECGRPVCSPGRPWQPRDGKPAIHPNASEVGEQKDGWPGGDIVTYRCPDCGVRWRSELPQ